MKHHLKTASIVQTGLAALLSSVLCGPALAGAADEEPALALSAADSGLQWGPCPEFFGEGCHIAVLHGNPAEPNADVFFRLAGRRTFPAHRHTSAERMILVAGEMDVSYEGQSTVRLSPGTYAYGPAGRVHWGQCVSEEPCVLFIAFEQPVDATQVVVE